jgi:RNA polymerase sigma-70 factor (ECF subfamily)
LLVRAQSQDQAAWQRLVSLYTPLVYRWCRMSGLQAADAADVGQEVFRAVARKIGEFRRDQPGDSFRAWLRVITRNKITDHHRQMPIDVLGDSTAQTLIQQVPNEPPTPEADAEEGSILFRKAVELIQTEFEERTWRAFWRTAIDGVEAAAVAGELEVTPNAVYLAKARVLRRLREEFADMEQL